MTMQQTIFVGLSGGVDSSVAALRLLKEGYSVVGVFIKVWQPNWLDCNWEEERLDAMRVAAKLNIPFLTCDAQQAYKDDVADYFISEYKEGRTPNPDVMCNKYVKFGAFMKFAEENGADFIATGHYAQRIKSQGLNDERSKATIQNLCSDVSPDGKIAGPDPLDDSGEYELLRGVDEGKDQTYFLWTLTQEQLSKILLPVGNSTKKIIREEAQEAGLLTADKKDSQGVCFLGHIDIPEFLSHYIDLQKGDVLNTKGEVIGEHVGALVYTNGQRHGFTVTSKDTQRNALYVVARDIKNNTITVSSEKITTHRSDTLTIYSLNLIGEPVALLQKFQLQTRYRQMPIACKVLHISADSMELLLLDESDIPSSGQSCVLYDGPVCLGGGIIA